ncbi:MAG: hypothetical protein KAS32_15520 [Candidatus Peribacteraceae bacterium]|nr:hypothetical protein [Candidatus Peribacteraceae bacterium]
MGAFKLPAYIAIRKAKEIQKANTSKILCGSLALYLHGVLKTKFISDLDFCIEDTTVPSNQYKHDNLWFPHTHCLFRLHEVKHKTIKGIIVQDLQTILNWKAKFNRPKDNEVISAIEQNGVAQLEFELDIIIKKEYKEYESFI